MPVTTIEELRQIYGEPKETTLKKILSALDKHCINFIAHSPYIILSTSNKNRHADASPKGDKSGFVQVVDRSTLLIPERVGNNIADSLINILENPEIGILFLIPGIRETLRVNGTCEIVSDTDILSAFSVKGKLPRSVIKVSVREAYLHCGKSIIRSDLWGDTHKITQKNFPTLGTMLGDQIAEIDGKTSDQYLERSYKKNLY